MKSEKILIKSDSRNRVCLTKLGKEIPKYYKAYSEGDKIILEPLKEEINEDNAWIFKPENKAILKELKKALKQKGTIDRGSFIKYLKD